MKNIQDLEKLFSTEQNNITEIEILYPNGGTVTGTIKKIKLKPLKLSLIKLLKDGKKGAKHNVVFDHVVSMKIRFNDGSSKQYK